MIADRDGLRRRLSYGRLLLASFVAVTAVRAALYLFPYRSIRRWMPAAAGRPDSRYYARKVAYCVGRTARLVPGASCLTQALAAQYLLARSGHRATIRIGGRRDEAGMVRAHAWLICEGAVVLGGREEHLSRYVPLTDLD